MSASEQCIHGQVLASYGSHALVDCEDGENRECSIKGKRLRPVAGDRVSITLADNGGAVIAHIHERESELARQSGGGRHAQVLAANLDTLVVVIAPEPWPEPGIVDRYLAAAEHLGLQALIVLNKIDLTADEEPDWLSEFETLGYGVFRTSAERGTGLDALRARLARHTASLVGQSGVGKSSLLNRLMGEAIARTGEISDRSGEGRHTTTTAFLHRLPGQPGGLIDSPGVRDYHLPPVPPERVPFLFREIREAGSGCRFNNCRHRNEPGCAVMDAVDAGAIAQRRYRSFLRLLEQMETIGERNPGLFPR
ncbi:ribosome small subunit-dependent GTPase A [Natronospira bacteriovora]|uniref:Small ribosomal subunit biogenesis GTPase RsgA n=1 Tax=Natronospira bacteriovora TaxID=3069753 RepID=A0ABU0W367_9GAMM|nr:ribosome small subunit-dependent GTPase A [Natronospira sp. AB-CW4]MDQ2068417.1 ribosome small subunit-dependent GTPase A [Natronospira sp. AB-CW4]